MVSSDITVELEDTSAGASWMSLNSRCACAVLFFLSFSSYAQNQKYAGPQPVPLPPAIAEPLDIPYPGMITLDVNATDIARHIVRVHETVPVAKPGDLVLLLPKWLPGAHSPTGQISRIAGVTFTAHGKQLRWVRDQVEVFAFHVDVPPDAKSVDVDFQYLSPIRKAEGRMEISDQIVDLQWISTLLYPAGYFSRQIHVTPSVEIPSGWKFATALEPDVQRGNRVRFKSTTLNTLVDSPLYAGLNYNRIDLSTDAKNRVYLNLFGDKPADVILSPEQIELHKRIVLEAQKAYGSHHYDHYDFLFLLSDKVGGIGLEHHQSSEDGAPANYYTDWAAGVARRDLLAHEYTHSWNGKFRRPADLWTPNFNVPMRDDLLWVYEGMTQYYGNVLTARAGLRTPSQFRDGLAMVAANYERNREGFQWRTLEDTTNDPTVARRSPLPYRSWQMSEDYYSGGQMMWLDVDAKLRSLTHDKSSLDDFARAFFGVENGSYVPKTYTFDDVVAALNGVVKFDWASFLKDRAYTVNPPLQDGLAAAGWKLVYD